MNSLVTVVGLSKNKRPKSTIKLIIMVVFDTFPYVFNAHVQPIFSNLEMYIYSMALKTKPATKFISLTEFIFTLCR